MSPDLKHALCFVEPLGGKEATAVIVALNRASRFLRLRLGPAIEMRFTPSLKFVHDDSFDTAEHINRLLADPRVRRDLDAAGKAQDYNAPGPGDQGDEPDLDAG